MPASFALLLAPLVVLAIDTAVCATESSASEGAVDSGRASWVEGRIRLPADTPPDEELRVVVLGLAHDDPIVHALREPARDFFANAAGPAKAGATRVEVGPDGRFRAPFAEGSDLGFVWLEANYLYLAEPVELELPADERLSLEPEIGARVSGRFELPDGFDAARLEPIDVQILGWSLVGGRGNHRAARRVGSDLAFDFGGLPADLGYFLRADPKVLAVFADTSLPVKAGERTERIYPLVPGGRISGRVLDAAGRPLPGAEVAAEPDVTRMFFGAFGRRTTTSGADGRFELRFVGGRYTVSARAEGYVEARSEEFELGEGASVQDLVLRLEAGG